jgi:hypothetical protein
VTEAIGWLAAYADRHRLTYEPDADERWPRAFEPFATLRTPLRYAHALHATGDAGSVSIARFFVDGSSAPEARGGSHPQTEASAWVALVQDVRLTGATVAAASDARPASPFAEPIDLVTLPRKTTRDAAFDRAFATFAPSDADVARALTPSVRKLVLSWRIPLHFEIRPGAFLLAPVALPADPASLAWLLGAVQFFGEKAAKRAK